MPNGDGALDFEAVLKTVDFKKELADLENRIKGFSTTTVRETNKIDDIFSKLTKTAAVAIVFEQAKELTGQIVKIRGEFQNLEIAFTTMLKSKAAADKLLGEITQFAAKTPFTLTEVATGAKQLLAYGSSAKSVVSEIKTLGDVAAGVSAPIGDLIYLYGTLRTQGRAYTTDIRQFAGRGIPIYEELGKVLKINTSEVAAFVEAGKVGFKEVEQAFKNMTTNGGIFEGLTEKTSKSLTGLMSNFGDAVDRAFNKIGQSQEGLLASGITTATELVDNYEKVVDILKVVVATYGAYRAAMFTIAAAQTLINTSSAATLYLELARSLGVVTNAHKLNAVAIGISTKAQAAFNTVASINPYVALVTVVVALSAAVWVLSDNTTAAQKAFEGLANLEANLKKQKEELIAKTNELSSVVRSETSSRFAQLEAFKQLQGLYPELLSNMDLDTFKKIEATKAQKDFNKSVDEFDLSNLKKQLESLNKESENIQKNIKSLKEAQSLSGNQGASLTTQIDKQNRAYEETLIKIKETKRILEEKRQLEYEANTPIAEQIKHYEGVKSSLEARKTLLENSISLQSKVNESGKSLIPIFDRIRLTELNKDLDEVNRKLGNLNQSGTKLVTQGGDKTYWENIKKTNEELRNGLGYNQRGGAEWKKYTLAIDEADKKLQAWNRTSSKSKDTKVVFSSGSLGYYEEIVKKVNDDLKKITNTNSDEFAKLQLKRANAEEEIAKIREKLEKDYANNSIRNYENIAKKAEEALTKVNPNDTTEVERLKSTKVEAERQAEVLRLQITSRSFDEEIEYKKTQYELYNRWVQSLGEDAANTQFADLLKQGNSFKDFLESQISVLEAKVKAGTATAQDKDNLVKAKVTLDIDNEVIDKYKQRIIDTQGEVSSLTEQLTLLREEQAKLGNADTDKTKFIVEQIVDVERQRKDLLKNFLIDNNVGEAQRLVITKKYADLRIQLEKETADKTSAAYLEGLAKINSEEKSALAEQAADKVSKNSEVYKELTKIVAGESRKQLLIFIESLKERLKLLKESGASESEEYKKVTDDLENANRSLIEGGKRRYSEFLGIIGQIGGELQGIDGTLGKIGSSLIELSSRAGSILNVVEGYKKIKLATTDAEKASATSAANQASQMLIVQAAIENLIGAINNISNAYKANKAAQNSYYETVKNQQSEYNKLLNDEIRLKTQRFANPFYKDYTAIFNDSATAQLDALQKFNKELEILQNSGKAKDGTTVKIDWVDAITGFIANPWKNFGKGIGTGDKLTPIFEKYPDLIDSAKSGVDRFNISLAKSLISTNAVDEATKAQLQTTIEWAEKYNQAQLQLQDTLVDLVGQIGNDLKSAFEEAFAAGTDSAQAFGKVFGDIIGKISRQMVFTALIKPLTDTFLAETKASFDTLNGGDGSIADDLIRFYDGLKGVTPKIEEAYKSIDEMLKSYGFNDAVLGGTANKNINSLSGSIKSVTEETAGLLAGQINAIRITQVQHLQVNRDQLLALTNISRNSDFMKYLPLLESIDKKIGSSDLRAGGLG